MSSRPSIHPCYSLLSMVEALGRADALDDYNKEKIIQPDIFDAAQSLSYHSLALTWDPRELSHEEQEMIIP